MTIDLQTVDIATRINRAIAAHDTGDTDAYEQTIAHMCADGWTNLADMLCAWLADAQLSEDPDRYPGDDAGPFPATVDARSLAAAAVTLPGDPPF